MAVSVHPGTIMSTGLTASANNSSALKFLKQFSNPRFWWDEFKDIPQGASTTMRCVSLKNDEIKGGHWYLNCRSMDDENRLYQTAREDKQLYGNQLADTLEELSKLLVENKGFRLSLE